MYVCVLFCFVFNTNAAENMMFTKVLVLSAVEPAKELQLALAIISSLNPYFPAI